MGEVQVIKAQKDKIDRSNGVVISKMRAAAYCRVSTDSDEQMNSYQAQMTHYKNVIEQNADWELVDIYADAGLSGTQSDNRGDFQRMITDVVNGFVDVIITKSISRFARNTMDTLKYVRLFKEHQVAIIFEKENINTLTMNGEMLLTILSSLAQQESESLSANTKMGLKMKMKRGELVGYQGCLGYDYDRETKSITINEEEAVTVRYIFDRYTTGIGCFVIAKELTQMGAKTKRGNTEWGDSTVRGIITNEKYKGDVLMQKTFTVDPISKRRLDNFGEEEKYYIANHHEPIISEEQFEQAQKILRKRSKNFNHGRMDKFSQQYTFSSMIECGFCGGGITRRRWNSGTPHQKNIWYCVTAVKKGKKNCPECKGVEESIIENAFVKAFNILCKEQGDIVDSFLKSVEDGLHGKENKKQLNKLNSEINGTEIKISKLLDLHLDGKIDKIDYEDKYEELRSKLDGLKTQRLELDTLQDQEKTIVQRVTAFRKIFESGKELTEFDPDVFKTVIEKVILGGLDADGIADPYMITFIFKTGLTSQVKGEKTARKKKDKDGDEICSHQAGQACGDGSIDVKGQVIKCEKGLISGLFLLSKI